MTLQAVLIIAMAGVLVWLAWATHTANGQRKITRAAYFSALPPLFDGFIARTQPTGFARATATRGGVSFDLQAVTDSLTFRKLPALWVMLTLPAPQPVMAHVHIMARPSGFEPFSHFTQMPHSLPCPDSFPEGCVVRCSDAAQAPPMALIARHAAVFQDPRVKELVITPMGLRLVILTEEAERGRYLIFRDAELGAQPLPADRIAPLITTLLALREDLISTAEAT